jgi:hypothetical protein
LYCNPDAKAMKTQKFLNSASALSRGVIRSRFNLEAGSQHQRQGIEPQWGNQEDCAEPSDVGGTLQPDPNCVRQGIWLLVAETL